MIPAEPMPKFLLVCIVEKAKTMHGELAVIMSQPCSLGRVEANASEKYKDVKVGDVVYFRQDNANPVRLDTVRMHAWIFEDALMGVSRQDQIEVQPMMMPDHMPNSAIMTPKGVSFPIPGSHRVN